MTRTARAIAAASVLGLLVAAAGCGAPPWRMGAPLSGRPAIPDRPALPTVPEARAAAAAARAAGQTVLEVSALLLLQNAGGLRPPERSRLADLLVARAAMFHDMGRAIPESADLEAASWLDQKRGALLRDARAEAAVAAGDAWKAIRAPIEARNAYSRAVFLGGVRPGTAPGSREAPPVPPAAPLELPSDFEAWVLAGPALSARLVPLAAAFPTVLDDGARALRWADLMLDEDPTSPDVRELVALIFGRARRFGGTERMLMELVYYSPDRARGLARGAAVWDRVGRPREGCAQWIRAARWRNDPEDPAWRMAIACARRDSGAGDWREIRAYVLDRAPPDRRESLAAELDVSATEPARPIPPKATAP